MVRLKHGFIVKCTGFDKDANGNVTAVYCDYFPESRSGHDTSGLNAKGVLHWVSAAQAIPVELRIYDRFKSYLNPDSLKVVEGFAEPALAGATHENRYQFLRKGYFCLDKDSQPQSMIFNRTVTLKDGWKNN
jgi:glutaminyl-tRNA synthetase